MVIKEFPFLIDKIIGEGIMTIFGYNAILVWLFFSLMITFFGIALRVSNIVIIVSLIFFTFAILSEVIPLWITATAVIALGIFLGLVFFLTIFGR